MNGLGYSSGNPPSTISVNAYSEPFDSIWRHGFTGIGTASWPTTRLHVHNNDNVDANLSSLMSSLGIVPTYFTSIFTNGGNAQNPFTSSILGYIYHNSNTPQQDNNMAITARAQGDNNNLNNGVSGEANGSGNVDLFGVLGSADGNGNVRNAGVFGVGSNQSWANFGVWGQCNTPDVNSVNVGVFGRGVFGSQGEPALVNIGVHGRAECSGSGGGGTQFNCGVYGQNLGCMSDSSHTPITGNYAGYFDGDLFYTGNLWALSDQRLKENIKSVGSVTERLSKVKIYSYNFIQNTGLSLSKGKEYGVLAQELEIEFPELVQSVRVINNKNPQSYRSIDTYKSVEYTSFIPLLIQSVKELSEKINKIENERGLAASNDLKNKIDELEKNLNYAASTTNNSNYLSAYPNPSSTEMIIDIKDLFCSNCLLMITDLSGKLIKQYPINGINDKVRLSKDEFSSGIFQCSLVVENKVISSIKIAFNN